MSEVAWHLPCPLLYFLLSWTLIYWPSQTQNRKSALLQGFLATTFQSCFSWAVFPKVLTFYTESSLEQFVGHWSQSFKHEGWTLFQNGYVRTGRKSGWSMVRCGSPHQVYGPYGTITSWNKLEQALWSRVGNQGAVTGCEFWASFLFSSPSSGLAWLAPWDRETTPF